jgi:hypothetical protein
MKKDKQLSTNEEMLIWTSYRYCIGRKTYVSALAKHIGITYYNKLSDNRKIFMARDIRKEIAGCLSFGGVDFEYEYSVPEKERNPIEDFLTWINENYKGQDSIAYTKSIICYKEAWKEDAPKLYEIITTNREVTSTLDEFDYVNLFDWDALANLFDVEHHKLVHVKYNGNESVYECFEIWRNKLTRINGLAYKNEPFKYEKRYISVENFLETGEFYYLNEDFITHVENMTNENGNENGKN